MIGGDISTVGRNKKAMVKSLKKRRASAVLILLLITICVVINYTENDVPELPLPDILIFKHNGINRLKVQKPQCPDVANGMMRGRWKSRPLSSEEKTIMDSFLESARTEHGMPKSMQRVDGMCGNVAYENLTWFRAVCNPEGPTPCCFNNKCVNVSSDLCDCDNCYDLRTRIHAEYSGWIPENPQCEVKNFSASDACELLYNTHLVVVGDSLVREIYIALLMILTNDRDYGAFQANMPKEIRNRCKGMFAFTEKMCRGYIAIDAKVCRDSAAVSMREFYQLAYTPQFHKLAKAFLHVKNTVLFVGMGLHESFDRKVFEKYILPVILMMKRQKAVWPRIIWSANHRFGILKSPLRPEQDNRHVEIFNKFMSEHLRQFNIPIFDTYNMTSGVMSQDGTHFGLGLNLMKAHMFLNFLQELRYKERW